MLADRAQGELYVVNIKPPSVAVIDAETMKVNGEIALDSEPSYGVLHPSNQFLYVLEEGIYRTDRSLKAGQSKVSVIDLGSRTKLKTIPIAWNTRNLALSADGKYIICVSNGKAASKKKLPEENGLVTVKTWTKTWKNVDTHKTREKKMWTPAIRGQEISIGWHDSLNRYLGQ